jgi:hypothetical protein
LRFAMRDDSVCGFLCALTVSTAKALCRLGF